MLEREQIPCEPKNRTACHSLTHHSITPPHHGPHSPICFQDNSKWKMATWPCCPQDSISSKFIPFCTLICFTWGGGREGFSLAHSCPFKARCRTWVNIFAVEFLYLVTVVVIQGLKPRNIPVFTSKLPFPTCGSAGAGIKGASSWWFHTRFGLLVPHWWYKEVLVFWMLNPHQLYVHTHVCTSIKSLWVQFFIF